MKLKIAALINLIVALFHALLSYSPALLLGLLILSALYYYDTEVNNKILDRKKSLILFAIITIPLNFISSILVFISVFEIKEEKKDQLTSEQKKVDILLKLGAFMIILSGILLTTTAVDAISDPVKVLILIVVSILLYSLSYLCEYKLKIKKTVETYFNLSMAFIVISYLAATQFNLLGEMLRNTDLSAAILFTISMITAFLSNKKFNKNIYKYLALSFMFLAINMYLIHFNVNFDIRFLISLIILSSLNLLDKKEYLNKFLAFSFIVFTPLFYLLNINQFNNLIILIVIVGILNGNLYHEHIKSVSSETKSVLISFATLLILFSSVMRIEQISVENKLLVVTIIFAAIYFKTIFVTLSKLIKLHLRIMINIGFLAIILLANTSLFQGLLNVDNSTNLVIASIILITNLFFILFDNKDFKLEHYLQPIKIILFIYFALATINIGVNYIYHILYLITFLLVLFFKDNKMKYIYLTTTFILIVNSLLMFDSVSNYIALLHIFIPLFAYVYLNRGEYNQTLKTIAYSAFLLILVAELAIVGNIISNKFDGSLIALIVLVNLANFYKKDKELFPITKYILTIPMITLIINSDVIFEINIMLTRIVLLYLLYVLNLTILKEHKQSKYINIVLLSLIMASLVFIQNIFIGIFIGILSLSIIYLSFKFKKYSYVFYVAIVSIIINLIVQLRDIWQSIPYWAYLLLTGLTLIAVVTYIELKKQNK